MSDLVLGTKVKLTATGIVITGEISRDEMMQLGYQIGGMHAAIQWAAGDYLVECERRFEHEAEALMDALGISLESRGQYRRVSEFIPPAERIDGLSWSHHRAVAHLEPEQRTHYLTEAKEQGWVKRELEAAVKSDLVTQQPASLDVTETPDVASAARAVVTQAKPIVNADESAVPNSALEELRRAIA